MNTKCISSNVLKISVISRVCNTSEIADIFNTFEEIFLVFTEKGKFSFVPIKEKTYFWPGLGLPRPKAIVVIPKNQPLPKLLRKKTSKSAKHACHYATKERPDRITMYLGLDIIIKIKFTTIFDRCAIIKRTKLFD